jgi:four helix bundle protein
MALITRFEEIEAWQKARELTQGIYAYSKVGAFGKDFGLRDQIRRAAVSIMSNIAERFERGGKAEFLHFLSMAKGSAGEVESHLYVALDQGYISEDRFRELQDMVRATEKLLAGFMKYLKTSNI